MAIFKIFASADSTIYSRYPAKNTGLDEIIEVAVKNNEDIRNANSGVPTFYSDDIRRGIVKFSDADLAILKGYSTSGSSF